MSMVIEELVRSPFVGFVAFVLGLVLMGMAAVGGADA